MPNKKNYLRFLNHSCIELVTPNTTILCDPWFTGSAFSDGWSLLHDNSHDINNLSFDYIWISHEHPDHFSIPTINTLKKSKNFLFQKTKDQKVKKFLESKGHNVIELINKKLTKVGDLEIAIITCDSYDSILIAKFPNGIVVVNINDARVDQNDFVKFEIKPFIKQLYGEREIDLLAFQYSYANWAGNKSDKKIALHQQELVDKKNKYAIKELKPKFIMPFASFVYYSHEENFYWNGNDWLNHIDKVFNVNNQMILPNINQKILLENSISRDELQKSNEIAKKFWDSKIKNIKPLTSTKSIPNEILRNQYDYFIDKLHDNNQLFKKIETKEDFIISLRIFDLKKVISIGLFKNFFKLHDEEEKINITAEISSETFSFLLKSAYGRGTITINGRIQFNYDYAHRFFLFFFIFYANNLGIYFNKFSNVTRKMLESISKTAVMESILFFNAAARNNLDKDLDYLFLLFQKKSFSESDYEIFSNEPSII
jgi:hypothetical protein